MAALFPLHLERIKVPPSMSGSEASSSSSFGSRSAIPSRNSSFENGLNRLSTFADGAAAPLDFAALATKMSSMEGSVMMAGKDEVISSPLATLLQMRTDLLRSAPVEALSGTTSCFPVLSGALMRPTLSPQLGVPREH